MSITKPIHERTGSGGPELWRSSSRHSRSYWRSACSSCGASCSRAAATFAWISTRVGSRGARVSSHSPQRLGGELGGAIHGAVLARVLGIPLDRARDQARPLELVEHPVEALGVDRPRWPQTRAQTSPEVVAVTGTLQHEAEDRPLQRRGSPHPGAVTGAPPPLADSSSTAGKLSVDISTPGRPSDHHSVCSQNGTPNRSQVQRTLRTFQIE